VSVNIIITGTNPNTAKGGIGVVLPGYQKALSIAGIKNECVPTYDPTSFTGKWIPWFMSFPTLFNRIHDIKKSGNTPVVYSHVGDGVSFLRESLILLMSRILGAETIYQIHSPRVDGYLDNYIKRNLLKLALLPATKVCVLTQWWSNRLITSGFSNDIYVIPNPLPDELLNVASESCDSRVHTNQISLLTMARLVKGKGVDIMIRAAEYLPQNVKIVIAGDGEQRGELERLARNLGVSNKIEFIGWVSGHEKNNLLRNADIFCLPSTYDAFPMSMVEAMCYGVPVVAVKWGGIPDMVAHGKAGYLADAPDPEMVANMITMLLEPSKRSEMCINAKEWVLQISSPDHVACSLKRVISQL